MCCVTVSCNRLDEVEGFQWSIDLSNVNASVFTACPEALTEGADHFDASQITLLAQQALEVGVYCQIYYYEYC